MASSRLEKIGTIFTRQVNFMYNVLTDMDLTLQN